MSSPPVPPDLNALAAEALDLWQEHLAALAADPKAKAELAQLMEPSRRLFAEWIKKAQNGTHVPAPFTPASSPSASGGGAGVAPGAAAVRTADDDGALRLAQLAYRVAELEKRIAKLESRKASAAAKASAPAAKPGS